MDNVLGNILVSQDDDGQYITLKTLKEIKFGDKSILTHVKTTLDQYEISKDLNEDIVSCSTFKLYFAKSSSKAKRDVEQFQVSYLRVDGKPEKASLPSLIKV